MTRTSDLDDPGPPNRGEVFTPTDRGDWRRWLASCPDRADGLWVVYRKKSSSLEGPVYDDLVEEALRFGWIDGKGHRVDADRMMLWFSPRRPGGMWSALHGSGHARGGARTPLDESGTLDSGSRALRLLH